jgi:hypothetical protein
MMGNGCTHTSWSRTPNTLPMGNMVRFVRQRHLTSEENKVKRVKGMRTIRAVPHDGTRKACV